MHKYLLAAALGLVLLIGGLFLRVNLIPIADFELLTLAEKITLQTEVGLAPKWGTVLMGSGLAILLLVFISYYWPSKPGHKNYLVGAGLLALWIICVKMIFFPPQKEWVEGTVMKVYEDGYACFQTKKNAESRYSSDFGLYYFESSDSWQLREGQQIKVLTEGGSFIKFDEVFLPVIDVQPLADVSRSQE